MDLTVYLLLSNNETHLFRTFLNIGLRYVCYIKHNAFIISMPFPFIKIVHHQNRTANTPSHSHPNFQLIFLNTEHGWKWDSFRGDFWGEECESWWKDIWKRCSFTNLLSPLVTRFVATSMAYNMNMLIDINTDIYPLRANDKFTMVLANTLYKDNRPDPGVYTDYSKEVLFFMFFL